jgi:hypothetical protein
MSFLKNPKMTMVVVDYSSYDKLLKMSKNRESTMSGVIRNLIINQNKPILGWQTKHPKCLGTSTIIAVRLGSVTRRKLQSICSGSPRMKSEAIRRLIKNAEI